MKLRHELKHEINFADHLLLKNRLRKILPHDRHVGPEGEYLVRSLYFDDPFDRALTEKISGVNLREKFRIRCYNQDFSWIRLEKKSKRRGLSHKQAARLTEDEVRSILDGEYTFLLKSDIPLLQEFYFNLTSRLLRPCVIVEYYREPFVHPAGNTRVTLDRDIRTSGRNIDFFAIDPLQIPTDVAFAVLEVKYDQFLPEFIADAIQIGPRRSGAFSKYAHSRKYD
ncbi:MAG TPA: polyphosphate polymerase domain-containing protein [Clostridiaceae bacterium]|nr:polyphosphate polymerase domain-containing protein [Clostridiaceae bacterium]